MDAGPPLEPTAPATLDPRRELLELVRQARGLAELDLLLGLGTTPVPALARPQALVQAAPAPAPAAAPRPATPTLPAPPAPAQAPAPPAGPADEAGLAARRAEAEARLHALAQRMQGCTRCPLSEGRTQLVFGQGDAAAEVVFVGEAPGYHEDKEGLAFIGPAGQLLTKMIQAMGLEREEAFICNVAKCRPPNNRTPTPPEMATCLPFLEEQLEIVRPRVICALGKTAAVGLGLLRPGDSITRARGQWREWRGIPTMITFHPAYLLRSPSEKRHAWQDLQALFPHISRRRTS